MKKYNVVLVSGTARAGKDTFFDLLSQLNANFIGYSFAFELKEDLKPIVAPMGIDIHNPTDKQKKIIRNLMISYGCAWREIDINHWVKKVDKHIDKLEDYWIPVIRDNRFISETEYFINKYGRENILIVEISRNGAPPPPAEELINQPKITAIADVIINWDTDPSLISLKPKVQYFYDKYFLGYDQ
jgi:hypothetical protein